MTNQRIAFSSFILVVTTHIAANVFASPAMPASAGELFELSGQAYRSLPAVEVTFSTVVEMPGDEPAERVNRYILGKQGEAVIEIGAMMRVVADTDHIFAELPGHDDRYLAVEAGDTLSSGLAAVRGKSSLAGLWNPVPAALRDGLGTAGVLDAFRYSRHLGELSIAGFEALPGPRYEVLLKAGNGSCVARFDGVSFYLLEADCRLNPPNTPDGFELKISGRFDTRGLQYDEAMFKFDGGQRLAVDSLRDLSPKPPGMGRPAAEVVAGQVLLDHLVQLDDLAASLKDKDVLLVGEDHLYEEPPQYMVELLKRLDDRPVSLLLEMPTDIQAEIDRYLEDGSESSLKGIFEGRLVLQLQSLLRWAQQNRDQVRVIKAIDEPLHEIFLKRAYLADTRNPTMAAAIHAEWLAHPESRVVVYAGMLHLMKNGRYKVNRPSRNTAGSRLPGLGISRDKTAVLWLNGGENFYLHDVWSKPGVLPISQLPVRIPIPYFIDYPIFGVEYADEIFDYFVNLGPLTRIEVNVQ